MVGPFSGSFPVPETDRSPAATGQIQARALPNLVNLIISDGYDTLFVYKCGYTASLDEFNNWGLAEEVLCLSTGGSGSLPALDPGNGYIAIDLGGIPDANILFDSRTIVHAYVGLMRTAPLPGAAGDPPVVKSKP